MSACCARRWSVHVSESEEVSEPANMKVLMLWRMSSSDILFSGARSFEAFDFTGSLG